ncbi:hypothetical protein DVH24_002084 [Malus domestica]|uniref:Peptidase C1A papain C-terminal domain-containing protein n=1 Tax=Malus domestica TaxID=3750 RepID=A0A498I4Z3_MALDO|nr:hypothetical protein DVH24_002084 [Malus domestica]
MACYGCAYTDINEEKCFIYSRKTWNWRKKGDVTPTKDQGQCGCCWTSSAVAAMEGITKLTTGKLMALSKQEFVDCDTSGVEQGCEGGSSPIILLYVSLAIVMENERLE